MSVPGDKEDVVLQFTGNLKPAEMQKKLLSLPGRGLERVVIDLSACESVDPSVLGSILLLRQALSEEGASLHVRGCSDSVLSVFQRLRMERLLYV
jgi:anti-anti-sigma regulatory factor